MRRARAVPTPEGEWVYASRGITMFLDTRTDIRRHLAVCAATSVAHDQASLRPELDKSASG